MKIGWWHSFKWNEVAKEQKWQITRIHMNKNVSTSLLSQSSFSFDYGKEYVLFLINNKSIDTNVVKMLFGFKWGDILEQATSWVSRCKTVKC